MCAACTNKEDNLEAQYQQEVERKIAYYEQFKSFWQYTYTDVRTGRRWVDLDNFPYKDTPLGKEYIQMIEEDNALNSNCDCDSTTKGKTSFLE